MSARPPDRLCLMAIPRRATVLVAKAITLTGLILVTGAIEADQFGQQFGAHAVRLAQDGVHPQPLAHRRAS